MSTNKTLPLSEDELARFEDSLDLETDLIQAVREMRAGLLHVVYSPLIATRQKMDLSQQQFAELLGISTAMLEDWEQQRQEPNAAAQALMAQVLNHPDAASLRP